MLFRYTFCDFHFSPPLWLLFAAFGNNMRRVKKKIHFFLLFLLAIIVNIVCLFFVTFWDGFPTSFALDFRAHLCQDDNIVIGSIKRSAVAETTFIRKITSYRFDDNSTFRFGFDKYKRNRPVTSSGCKYAKYVSVFHDFSLL